MKNAAEARLDSLSTASVAEGIRMAHRRRMLEAFIDFKGKENSDSVLDVSISSVEPITATDHPFHEYASSQGKMMVTNCEVLPAAKGKPWHIDYSNIQASQSADSRRFPFNDQAFDWVYCNGVIENAGSFEEQYAFIEELWRISRKGVFLTTSNRKHFIEFNTGIPLLHWLPRNLWKRSLRAMGKDAWADESMLNLLDTVTLEKMTQQLPGSPKAEIGHLRFAVMKAHFFLMIRK